MRTEKKRWWQYGFVGRKPTGYCFGFKKDVENISFSEEWCRNTYRKPIKIPLFSWLEKELGLAQTRADKANSYVLEIRNLVERAK